MGLGTTAVVTAAGDLQQSSGAVLPSEDSIARGGDLNGRLDVLEFSAASELSAVEVIAKRYGLNIIVEPEVPMHRLNAKGSDISAREALDFVVRDYTGGSWRAEGSGVIRVSMPTAQDGRIRTREYDFSSVVHRALGALDATEASREIVDEATVKLRKVLLDIAGGVLKHAYPDSPCELTMEGDRMRLMAGGRCLDALASLLEGLRYPIPCLLYTSPSPRDLSTSRMPSSA